MLLFTLLGCPKQAPEPVVQEPSCSVPKASGFMASGGVATWTGDLDGDGRGDRVVRGAISNWQGALTDVVLNCRDGERKLLELKAKEINVTEHRFHGWLTLDVPRGKDADDQPAGGPYAFSASASAYVPGLQAAQAAGCPAWGLGVRELSIEGQAATFGTAGHEVAWTGDLDGNAHMDWILIEDGTFDPTGSAYKVVLGCPDGHGALVLEDAFTSLEPDYESTDAFVRLNAHRLDEVGVDEALVLGLLSVQDGVYTPLEE